jgi:uncharacterized membrane protein (TIGR01666 family)
MINKTTHEIKDFLLSTYFGDGLRITFGAVLPSLVLAQFGLLKIGITVSLGALCASIADAPGPIIHRRNAMFYTIFIVSIVSLLTSLCNFSEYLTGLLILVLTFIFSMFYVYGNRAASIGVAALLVMTLGIGDIRPLNEMLLYALYIFLGGCWYAALSLSLYRIMPYRLARQSLAECMMELADFLRIKAKFYHEGVDYDETYKELVEAQILMNTQQDAVRELLFKSRRIVQESTQEGRFLLVIFVDMMDLYEQILSTFYNYQNLHKQFDETGILKDFEEILNLLAEQMEEISFSLRTFTKPEFKGDIAHKVRDLKKNIESLEENKANHTYTNVGLQALKNIELNVENIFLRLKKIKGYFEERKREKLVKNNIQTAFFISHQEYSWDIFEDNLNLKSENFRHALRVSGLMLLGFIIAQSFHFLHSNWILLTIMVIMKPAYSLTKERNLDRLIGTIGGAIIGAIVLNNVTDNRWLFAILLVCMLGTYSFQRKTYLVSVVFMTPFILILFDFLGMGSRALLIERVYDTLIGGGIAFAGSYLFLPNWEHQKFKITLVEMLEANMAYYHQVSQLYFGEKYQRVPYKIVRKEVYVRSANLASAFQRMFSEPKHKQVSIDEIHKFSVLNHLFSSYVATLALYAQEHSEELIAYENLNKVAQNTEILLKEAIKIVEESEFVEKENIKILSLHEKRTTGILPVENSPDGKDSRGTSNEQTLIPEQFINIQKVAYDICKISERIDL